MKELLALRDEVFRDRTVAFHWNLDKIVEVNSNRLDGFDTDLTGEDEEFSNFNTATGRAGDENMNMTSIHSSVSSIVNWSFGSLRFWMSKSPNPESSSV